MFKTASRLMATAAAASLAFAPIAAQANTRASDNAPVYTASESQPGTAREAEGENIRGSQGIVIALLAAAATIAAIVIAAGNEDDDQSPGT